MTGAEDSGATVARTPAALRDQVARLHHQLTSAALSTDDPVAIRLRRSVLRPLNDALGADTPVVAPDGSCPTLRELALAATRLRATGGASPELVEASAALQDLACRAAEAESQEALQAALTELHALQADLEPAIEPAPAGPYLTTNVSELRDWLGCAVPTRPQMALCRCGASSIKPFCDGSHAEVGFDDAKSPDRVADQRDTYIGQQVTIFDNRGICQHSGFCTDRLATVFRAREEPFVHPSGGRMDEIIRAVRDCPSGALGYAVDGVEARDGADHHDLREPAIEITKDGPYRITGAIRLDGPDGTPVARNQGVSREHYALCRCGQSQNKPFCSGMHWYVEFHDPMPDPDATPSMFEWAGGLPALTRMTRLFYEKHVPADPLLAPLFADMSADHPERVARWLGEVFGGPPAYSENYGGYPRMLSQHIGKNLKEDWRRRWVDLLLRSAREAGLPNDPEFRSAFQSYIEWGSRLAVENSQTDAHPPRQMPMPHWDWNTAAGPPGSRISALAPAAHQPDPPIVLPSSDEPLSYDTHIKQLFRAQDRNSMHFAFDLWSYDEVSAHATAIYERVENGSMPCDGRWPAERIAVLKRWIDVGMPR